MKTAIAGLLPASLLASMLASPAWSQDLFSCGYQNLPLVMEQVPSSWWNYSFNNDAMWLWNNYMDVYRYTSSNGTWGQNGVNEFGGWPSNADLQATWGVSWAPGFYGYTLSRQSGTCGRLTETDVVFNPSMSWSSDAIVAQDTGSIFYLRAVFHELGHTWGEMVGDETYDYDWPSVMHSYYYSMVQPSLTIHAADALLMRSTYDNQTAVLSRKDMATFSHYASNGLRNSWADRSSYEPGQSITINHLTVENTGTRPVTNAHIRLVLSRDRQTIDTSDRLIGDWYWSSFPAQAVGAYDLTTTIPSDVSSGNYYVGAIMTCDGYGGDDLSYNDKTYLFSPIAVRLGDDRFEDNDSWYQATTVEEGSYYDLRSLGYDDDWYQVFVYAGQALDLTVQFAHATGDIDMMLFDSRLNVVDASGGVADSENVGFSAAPEEGWYYARVYEYAGAQNGYSLHVDSGPLPTRAVLTADVKKVHAPRGGGQGLTLDGGPGFAGKYYLVIGSLSGSVPGFDLRGHHVPLNPDRYLNWSATHFNQGLLWHTAGQLDALGRASARIDLSSAVATLLAGQVLHHAFLVLDPDGTVRAASNAVPLRVEIGGAQPASTPTVFVP